MQRFATSALSFFLLLAPAATHAEEHAASHYARGLIEFHAERYPAALELFDRAVEAGSEDPYALYYRGVTRGHTSDWAGAETDLRRVVELAPELTRPRLELGTVLFHLARYGDALEWFRRAAEDPELAPDAALYSGVCRLRMGDTEGALAELSVPAAQDDSVAVAAHYYRALANDRAGDSKAAARDFTWVEQNAPGTDMAREATAYLGSSDAAQTTRPYTLYGKVGFAYDSNVLLAADGSELDLGDGRVEHEKGDGRSELTVGGIVSGNVTESLSVVAGVEVYRNLHFALSQFDLQDHRISAQLAWKPDERLSVGLLTRYDYYLLDNDGFLSEGTLLPWASFSQGDFGRNDVHYRFRSCDYRQTAFENALNGNNHAAGFRQYKYFGTASRYIAAGYRYIVQDLHGTDDDTFAFDAHEAGAGAGWDLPWNLDAELDYTYRHQDYDSDSGGRDDDEHRVIFEIRRPLHRNLNLIATYIGTFNDSTDPSFEYDRHTGSLTLEVTL